MKQEISTDKIYLRSIIIKFVRVTRRIFADVFTVVVDQVIRDTLRVLWVPQKLPE